ncbi:hypothetical protein BDW74DRAFT_170024 [Aspergillus multicolor]|uniref:alpha-hydroxy acid oxidase n=1 Tax=Aspergillus multicolor TaxID=41759 RepID=UPI003CCDE1F9
MANPSPPAREILSLADLETIAARKLPKPVWEFYSAGATTQVTVKENSSAFSKYRIIPRVLRDVSALDTATSIFGQKISFPLCISPAGLQAMAHPDGELATSRACARIGVNMGVSSYANYSVEEIAAAGKSVENGTINHAMQLYTMNDRTKEEKIIQRAEKAGCKAIFLTADSPILGVRWSEIRNGFIPPVGLGYPMLHKRSKDIQAQSHGDGFAAFNSSSHSWETEIPWLRARTNMEIWIKGVLCPEDVEVAIRYGCDGVIISNHGGRQLDETPATIDVLAACAEAARGRIRVHVDGGIRSGNDIFKAVALGAECCWVGRPVFWGLAYDGERGVQLMLEILKGEFARCMQLAGCKSVSEISPASLGIFRADGPLARL